MEQTVVSMGSVRGRVHPVVIFNICDCFVRRPDKAERVIGTLLGSVLPDGTVDIRNSYAVPHSEASGTVALDVEYHQNMLNAHTKVNPKEVIVGWYSTGLGVSGGSAVIQDYYSRVAPPNPIHLTVDTSFSGGRPTVRAYVSSSLSLSQRPLAAHFLQIPLDLSLLQSHSLESDILKSTSVDKIPSDLHAMEASMERLLAVIEHVQKYVDDVVDGNIAPDNAIGRFISETVASVPKLSPLAFDKLVDDTLQDHLLLLYLSSITRTQLSLAEKLNTAAQLL